MRRNMCRRRRNVEGTPTEVNMLISEQLYLLLTRATGTKEPSASMRAYGLAAGVITDLVAAGKITLSDEKRPRVNIVDAAPTGNAVLDFGLAALQKRDGRRLEEVITSSKLDPTDVVANSLIQQGILAEGDRTFFGLGKPRTPEVNPIPEQQLRARLAQVLAGTQAPTAADATVLVTLQGLGAAKQVLRDDIQGMSGGDLKRRIKEVMADAPTGDAVERAIAAVNSAVMIAVMVPAIAAASVSG